MVLITYLKHDLTHFFLTYKSSEWFVYISIKGLVRLRSSYLFAFGGDRGKNMGKALLCASSSITWRGSVRPVCPISGDVKIGRRVCCYRLAPLTLKFLISFPLSGFSSYWWPLPGFTISWGITTWCYSITLLGGELCLPKFLCWNPNLPPYLRMGFYLEIESTGLHRVGHDWATNTFTTLAPHSGQQNQADCGSEEKMRTRGKTADRSEHYRFGEGPAPSCERTRPLISLSAMAF